jgi:hypothetical protein
VTDLDLDAIERELLKAASWIGTGEPPTVRIDVRALIAEILRLREELAEAYKWRGLAGCSSFEEMHAAIGMLADAQKDLRWLYTDLNTIEALWYHAADADHWCETIRAARAAKAKP